MNIRFGTIFCVAISVMAFNAHTIDMEHLNFKFKLEEYLNYMMGDDPVRYVRYFYLYVICRLIKGKIANQTLPLSISQLWAYMNGSLTFSHAELSATLPIRPQNIQLHGFSLESMLDYSYWIYWWAIASDSIIAELILWALPGALLYENYDLYGFIAGFLSNDHRTRSIY